MVEQGRFRSDLYYRLNVIPLSIPSLRERLDDVPALARYFADRFATETKCATPVLEASFIDRLQAYSWPGNIRELSNFMRRVLSLHKGSPIDADCFSKEFKPLGTVQAAPPAMPAPGTPICVLEKMHLENTLALAHGNRTHAAVMLGISLRTMRNKIREYGLPPRRFA
jgi:DNA-binding NtrC family response regulator